MSDDSAKDQHSTKRRKVLKWAGGTALAAAVAPFEATARKAAGDLYLAVLDKLGVPPGAPVLSPSQAVSDLLFPSAPQTTGVIQPGTNRLKLRSDPASKPSRYVSAAFRGATGVQKGLLGIVIDKAVNARAKELELRSQPNALILGGPVATPYFRLLGEYDDVPTRDEGTPVPMARANSALPFHFHVGNRLGYGRWGSEKRSVLRLTESGQERLFPLYGIRIASEGRCIDPPVEGKRLAGDMLMITRIPNPNRRGGVITMIGGLHGYSLEAFFLDLEKSAHLVDTLTERYKHDFFQLLIPYRLDRGCAATVDLSTKGTWVHRYAPVDGDRYLKQLG